MAADRGRGSSRIRITFLAGPIVQRSRNASRDEIAVSARSWRPALRSTPPRSEWRKLARGDPPFRQHSCAQLVDFIALLNRGFRKALCAGRWRYKMATE